MIIIKKKIILLIIVALASNFMVHGQCDPTITVSPSICSDPANNVYVIDPTADVEITIADPSGTAISGVVYDPVTFLYVTANQGVRIPTVGTNTFSVPNPSTSIFFNGNPHTDPPSLNPYPPSGAQTNAVYPIDVTFTLPDPTCSQDTETITLVTGGFTFDDLCRLDVKTLADVGSNHSVLSMYSSLIWYSDAGGTTTVPATTQINSEDVYYVDLGITGCAPLPVDIISKSPKPEADVSQKFCTATTWQASGFPSKGGDTLNDLTICGSSITWYSDAAGTQVIPNPASEVIMSGQTYYASQTINGCESELLEVTPVEEQCACIENPSFQDQSGGFNNSGFTFYTQDNGNASQVEACKTSSYILPGVSQYTATIDEYDYYNSNDVVNYVSPGLNEWLASNGVYIPTTSPFGCSDKSIKLNNDDGGSRTRTTMVKEFVAGEVLSFDFMFLMDDPGHPTIQEQPFVTIKLYDENGGLVQSRCVVADPENCIFNVITSTSKPGGGSHNLSIVYSDWSCVKLNTIELQGQKARLEITTGDCIYSVHWGTAYFDNFYVGDDGPGVCDSAFGYLKINPVASGTNDYEVCSLVQPPADPNCAPALPAINPNFPIDVYFDSVDPTRGNLTELNFDVIDNTGNTVFSPVPAAVQNPSQGVYYHTITQADLPAPYGVYTFESNGVYQMNCGSPYDYLVQAQSNGFKVCPTAGCPEAISFCDTSGPAPAPIDLEDALITSAVYDGANPNDLTLSYFTDLADAENGSGPSQITNLNAYPVPTTSETIYIRLDVDYTALGITAIDDCYDIVPLDILIGDSPNTPATVLDLEACGNGVDPSTFNLEDRLSDIFANLTQSDYTWEFYNDLNAAEAQDPSQEITQPTDYDSTGGETIYVRVMVGDGGCESIVSFNLVINELDYNVPAKLTECDQDQNPQDGETVFDLSEASTQIAGTNTDINATYYFTQTGAENQTAADAVPAPINSFTNTVDDNQTIYVYIEDTNTGCSVVEPLELEVVPSPTVNPAGPLSICDLDGDGSEQFDLSALSNIITGGATGVSIDYYPSQPEANNPTGPALPLQYTTGTTTVFARVESANPAGCFNTIGVDLIVNDAPALPTTIDALELCDTEQDGTREFDLTGAEADITVNEPSSGAYQVSYYESVADRQNDNAIAVADLGTYENTTSPQQTIYIAVEGPNGCISTNNFDIVVNPLPSFNTPEVLATCDEGASNGIAPFDLTQATAQITGNDPNLAVTYYTDQAGADSGTGDVGTSYTNTGSPYNDMLFVRIRNINTDCFVTSTLDLEVNEAPAAFTPQPLTYCDDDNDGKGSFILSDLDTEITGGAANVTVSYHQTQANADNDVLAVSSPFANTEDYNQTLYARVESPGVACFNTVEVELVVEDSPQPVQSLPALNACDPDGDGVAIFNLTDQEAAILANEANPADFTVRYYASQQDADNDTNEITVPGAYANTTNPQTIYVVVEGLNGCTNQTSFELNVNPLPSITTPQQLELCDYDNPGDEQEQFNLEDATLDITGGDTTIDITYHETQADADAGSNPLTSPYTNTQNNQTIYIRAEDEDTGCSQSQGFTLTLIVNPLPSPQVPTEPVEVCDTDNDGFEEFDLDEQIAIILNTEPDVSITFHLTEANAETGSNAIDTSQPFGLSSANNQTLYVRAENDLTGCYVVEELILEVVPTPEIITLEDLFVCDDDTANGLAVFDLTINTPNALGSQDPTDLLVTYHESQADAAAGIDAIVNPGSYTNTSNGQLIYVRIENTETGCIDTFDFTDDNSFSLNVEPLPVVNEPSVLQVCDDDYQTTPVSQTIFDLTTKEAEIAGQTPAPDSYEFKYYESIADQDNDNAIADPQNYENTANPQTIYITVVNTRTDNQCEDYTTLTLEVLPLPSPSETDLEALRLQECDDDNDGVAANPFDLEQSGLLIAGGENVEISYYKTENAAEEGDESVVEFIDTPAAYVNEPSFNERNDEGLIVQVIYARVDSGVNGNFCYVIVPFELQVVPAPELNPAGDPFGYTLCEDGTTGQAMVDFGDVTRNLYDNTNGDPSTIIPLLDPAVDQDQDIDNYTVTYYASEPDAEAGMNPLSNGELASDGDSFFIRVEYTDTGCFNTDAIGEVIITVEERPSIEDASIDEEVCSDEPGGNTATLDLTQYNGQVNPGSPQGTAVVYYANQADYDNDQAIQEPTFYTTVSNPQTIIAETINTATLCESPSVAEITIEVNDRPDVDLSNYDGLIICADTNPLTPVEGGNYDPIIIETGLDAADYTFVWTLDGSTLSEDGPSLTADQAGTYEVTVTDQDGNIACSTTTSATIEQGNPPEFEVSPLTLSFEEDHAILVSNITGEGDYEFRLNNGPWQAADEDGTLTFTDVAPGEHLVYGRDVNGCGTTVKVISFIDYPKFFTPNQDGYNDRWNIIGLQDQPQAKVYIFDRYGKLIKQLSPVGEGWDGTYNGKAMPSNDYWFRVEYMETLPDGSQQPREFKANFTLKR